MSADDFIIVRKRKKYKFARFDELPNCYEAEAFLHNIRENFAENSYVTIELGAGTGEFLIEHARLNPDRRFIAIDVKADRLYTGAKAAFSQKISNIIFVRSHAAQLSDIFKNESLDELWLTFSDPFPKKRHMKHRMTHIKFLQMYGKLLKKGGILHFKTDNHGLFVWSLEQFVAEKLTLRNLSFDLHESSLPATYKIMTPYEKRYVASGLPIHHVDVLFSSDN